MDNQQYLAEDEIDLRDYVNVLIKRKKLILAVVLVSVFTAAIASLLMPKVYEITSTIQLGSVNEPLIKKEDAKAIILNKNSLLSLIKELNLNIEVGRIEKSIKIEDVDGTNLLRIAVKYPDIDVAFKINNAISANIISQGQSVYRGKISILDERLAELDIEIKNIQKDIDGIRNLISGLPNSSNVSQADATLRIILLKNTLLDYERNLTLLRNQKNELKFALFNAKDFKVFDPPIKSKDPIAPNKKQIILISGIISIFFGMFLGFFMEFWQKGKEGEAKQ